MLTKESTQMSNPILEVAIGVSFVYLLLALMCTTANEMIAGWLNARAKTLEQGIVRMLGNSELKARLYQHPLIKSMSESDTSLPSYIPADKFAVALMSLLGGGSGPPNATALAEGARAAGGHLPEVMGAILHDRELKPNQIQQKVEAWFDQSMDRVSGWYKRKAQRKTLLLAALITLSMNADTVQIIKRLWVDPSLRASVVEQAKARVQKQETLPTAKYDDPDNPDSGEPIRVEYPAVSQQEQELLEQLMGWTSDWGVHDRFVSENAGAGWFSVQTLWLGWLVKNRLLGWILSALAISLGAPFWFDMLNRFMRVRNTGVSPQESDKTKAKTKGAAAVA
jgi:hypothetical protein